MQHLGTLLIIQQVIGQVQETVLPYLWYRRRKVQIVAQQQKDNGNHWRRNTDVGMEAVRAVTNNDEAIPEHYVQQAQIEMSKPEYEVHYFI